jgi:hypothetical protein
MRLHVTSQQTGEVVDLPVSKGLRILKRSELETRWGKFINEQPIPCITPKLSHLTPSELANGVDRFLKTSFDQEIPPDHIIRANEIKRRHVASLDVGADKTDSRRSLTRDNSKREERREQRAATRADLRRRFSQYKRFVREGDMDYFKRKMEMSSERSQSLKTIQEEFKAVKLEFRKDHPIHLRGSLLMMAAINFESSRRKLEVEAVFQEKSKSLRITRLPPLGWREWLYEQANLGDQAALSALRGIVYQAQRVSKRGNDNTHDSVESETEADTKECLEQQYRKAMARLLEQEKKEVAIRSARSDEMRPYEADALLLKCAGMQWYVTGNGNVTYCDLNGGHLFTDRGNRVTFDRVLVSDDDILLALVHAEQKFGNQLTLTGDDLVFTVRMACLADDMGMTILNPDMQQVIANHRNERVIKSALPASIEQTPTVVPADYSAQREGSLQEPEQANKPPVNQFDVPTNHERLRAMVLAIEPRAEFVIPDISVSHTIYGGPVAATFTAKDPVQGFAQHLGRGVYALHTANAPAHHNNASIEIQYRDGVAVATVPAVGKGKKGKTR